MSIRLMAHVWTRQLSHGEQSVLLAMADHANDDGGDCFPSMAYLAWKTDYTKRQVQNIVHAMVKKRFLLVVAHEQGGRGLATEYQIDLNAIPEKAAYTYGKGEEIAPFEPDKDENISPNAEPERVKFETQKGEISNTKGEIHDRKGEIAISPQPSVTTNEPSEEPLRVPRARGKRTPLTSSGVAPPSLKRITLTDSEHASLLEQFKEQPAFLSQQHIRDVIDEALDWNAGRTEKERWSNPISGVRNALWRRVEQWNQRQTNGSNGNGHTSGHTATGHGATSGGHAKAGAQYSTPGYKELAARLRGDGG